MCDNDRIIEEIRNLSSYFREAPYGQSRKEKYLPPNYIGYSRKVDDLIYLLQSLKEKDVVTTNEIDTIRSLRDNQLARLVVDVKNRNKEFANKYCDDELLSISQSIDMVINKFVSNK